MKFLFDLFPVILFFGVFKWGEGHQEAAHALVTQYLGGLMAGGVVPAAQAPILLATVVGIIATVLQIGYLLVRGRKVDGMLWVSLGVIAIMAAPPSTSTTRTSSSGSRPSCTGRSRWHCSSASCS
jgi:intracellular septation protein